jgi:hypothetical protein
VCIPRSLSLALSLSLTLSFPLSPCLSVLCPRPVQFQVNPELNPGAESPASASRGGWEAIVCPLLAASVELVV